MWCVAATRSASGATRSEVPGSLASEATLVGRSAGGAHSSMPNEAILMSLQGFQPFAVATWHCSQGWPWQLAAYGTARVSWGGRCQGTLQPGGGGGGGKNENTKKITRDSLCHAEDLLAVEMPPGKPKMTR